jgi:mono/diheme cytochrome c family protein
MKKHSFFVFLVSVGLMATPIVRAAAPPVDTTPSVPVPYLSPEAEAKTFVIPEGYRLELVLSDPIIREPVMAKFDGNGRLFVAEMRTYMQDIDGHNQLTTNSRVSFHWSSKGDGIFDKHSVFVDHLLLPRMILPVRDGLLVNETDSNDIWLYRDTDGDGVSDQKLLFYAGGPRGENLEHQQNGLIWALDNWMYMTVNAYRLRWKGTNVIQELTAPNGGQWGICQDNHGKLWFVNGGGEVGPLNFQVPIVYGAFNISDQVPADFTEVWPLVGLADVQGGAPRYRPENNTLNHFTATCGNEIFRGDRLPEDLRGDLLFAEPVGRLIRRAKVEVRDGLTYLRNAYDKTEFIRSTDPNFRPVNMMNAPDGTLYIVDMYRGIIQEGSWVQKGSSLRPIVEKYSLDKNFGRGRIWRLTHKDFKPGPQPHMLKEGSIELVAHLEHPNGWWRDTAQETLVLRGDKTVAPALVRLARQTTNSLARIHAIWTLEGLQSLDVPFLREMLKDSDPQVRVAAIRASESLYKAGDKSLVPDLEAMGKDPDPAVAIQALLTPHLLQWTNATALIEASIVSTESPGVREIASKLLRPTAESLDPQFTSDDLKRLQHGEAIYNELCFACHGPDGRGQPLQGGKPGETMAPPLVRSQTVTGHRDGVISVLLKGLSGPVGGKTYTALMVPMESNADDWIAAVASYVRNGFLNHATLVDTNDVARVRAAIRGRSDPWTPEELRAVVPQALANRSQWHVTASHNLGAVQQAVDGDMNTRYDSGSYQAPGMWFQIELPRETNVNALELDAGASAYDYPRGYQVHLSSDGQHWGEPVASGLGKRARTEIEFKPAKTRFIRITQTGAEKGVYWSIHEMKIYQFGP